MFSRYVVTSGLAAAITFGVFFMMQALITSSAKPLEEGVHGSVIDFVRLKRESEVELKKRKMPEKAPPPEPPPTPDMDFSRISNPGADIAMVAPAFDLDLNIAGGPYLGAAPSDADVIPLVRVNPQYPISAAERGIEGWVKVRFTITAAGTVKDPTVIESKPGSIFNRAALRAIAKWKYKPKIVDGVAVERHDVLVQLTFEMEND